MKYQKILKRVCLTSLTPLLIGCGPSYEAVKPNMTTTSMQANYHKVAELKYNSTINDINRSMGGIILDMKIIPYDSHFVSAKLSVDKYIRFDYIAPLRTSGNKGVSITEEQGTPLGFKLVQKVKLPAYKIGLNVFDLNKKGNFAYISDKKTIKIVKKIPTDSLEHLAKNRNYSKGNNVLTIKTKGSVEQIAFVPKSDNLIVLLENNEIQLWNIGKKKLLKTIKKYKNKVTAVKMSPLGTYLFVSTEDSSDLVYLKKNNNVLTIAGKITASDFTKEEDLLALTDSAADVSVYDVKNRKLLQKFPHQHKGLAYGLVFSPINNNTVITAGQDGAIKTWDLLNTKNPLSVKYNTYDEKSHCNAEWVKKQYFPKTSQSLNEFNKKYSPQVTECNILGDKAQVIDFANRDILHPYMTSLVDTLVNKYQPVKQEWINTEVLDSAVGSAKKEIYDWKRSHGTLTAMQGGANERLGNSYYAFNKDEYQNFLNTDKKILEYKAQTVKKKTEEYTHLIPQMNAGAIYGLVSYGRNIYTYGTGNQEKYSYYQTNTPNVRLGYGIAMYRFDFENSNQQNTYTMIEKDTFKDAGFTQYVIKTKDDHTVIAVKDNLVQFIDYKVNKIVDVIAENAEVKAIAYDKKNDILAIGLSSNIIKLWNLKSREPLAQLIGHQGEITALEFAKNGAILISGAYDESAIVWDVKSEKVITRFTGFERAAKRIEVLPQQNMIALVSSGNSDSDVFFYSMDNYKLIKKLSPSSGIIRGVISVEEGKRLILASSGETMNRQKGHILLTLDTNTFKMTKKYYKAPFTYIRGLVANEENNTLYAIGNSSQFVIFDLNELREVDTLSNMKDDKYTWGKIYAVGTTEQHMPIVSDGTRVLHIYK